MKEKKEKPIAAEETLRKEVKEIGLSGPLLRPTSFPLALADKNYRERAGREEPQPESQTNSEG
jgi:hypothetical protein